LSLPLVGTEVVECVASAHPGHLIPAALPAFFSGASLLARTDVRAGETIAGR